MKAVIQRVKSASVFINKEPVSSISYGLLIYLGIEKNDADKDINYLINKIINLRILKDNNNQMNLSVNNTNDEILVVSQFTLLANTKRGRRPSFENAETPELAKLLYKEFYNQIKTKGLNVKKGRFGKNMEIHAINDGPFTIVINSRI